MITRKYRYVRLPGKDRPFRHPGRLVHAQEQREDGSLYHDRMTICGRVPRESYENFIEQSGNVRVTCESCKKRMR